MFIHVYGHWHSAMKCKVPWSRLQWSIFMYRLALHDMYLMVLCQIIPLHVNMYDDSALILNALYHVSSFFSFFKTIMPELLCHVNLVENILWSISTHLVTICISSLCAFICLFLSDTIYTESVSSCNLVLYDWRNS